MKIGKDFIVTGGSGFIGSNFIHFLLNKYKDIRVTNIDKLTYAGRGGNNKDLEKDNRYEFLQEDICNFSRMKEIIRPKSVVINFAAESHVDNSIEDPFVFDESNYIGTRTLLEAARLKGAELFLQISTDEVYGSLGFDDNSSLEDDVFLPSSPYSASKAAAEMICLGNIKTYNQPIIITRSSNNFGPFQFPEKMIPLFITNLIRKKKIPLYGEGKNVRDWIYVEDNCKGIDMVIKHGKIGEAYNIGGGNELSNLELTNKILKIFGLEDDFIERVEDRKGHDLRYSLSTKKIKALGWVPENDFEESLKKTVNWYKDKENWWTPLKDNSGRRTS